LHKIWYPTQLRLEIRNFNTGHFGLLWVIMGHFDSLWLIMAHFGSFCVLVQPKLHSLFYIPI